MAKHKFAKTGIPDDVPGALQQYLRVGVRVHEVLFPLHFSHYRGTWVRWMYYHSASIVQGCPVHLGHRPLIDFVWVHRRPAARLFVPLP